MSSNTFELEGPVARRTDPHTSHESAEASKQTHKNVAEHILNLAAQRGRHGLTINEATDALSGQFKAVSVSPVFRPLVNKGKLVRRVIGKKANGRVKYETRTDPETNCPGIVHWHFKSVPFERTTDVEAVTAVRKQPQSETLAGAVKATRVERRQRERRQRDRRKAALSKS